MQKSFVTAFFILFSTVAQAQVAVTAKLDREQVRPGEVFYYTISVSAGDGNAAVQEPRLPNFGNFEMLSQNQENEMRSLFSNGKFQVQRSVNFRYGLTSIQPGTYDIGPAEVVVGGQAYKTNPVRIVVNESAPPAGGGGTPGQDEEMNDVDSLFSQLLRRQMGRQGGGGGAGGSARGSVVDLKDAFQIQVEVDKTSMYVGEQVTVSWYLVTRAQIADIDTLKYPAVEGFWREDIELATRLNFKPEIINGISFDRALLASFALFPIKPGTAKIDEYTAKCTVFAMTAFGGTGQQVQTKSSQVVPITVLPLPTEGKPADFSGAVGNFRVAATVDNTAATVGSPVSYKIRFEGRGNAKMIELPKIAWPDSLQAYEPKSNTKFFPDGRSFKEYEIILVPRQAGTIIIPATKVSFFDTNTKKYYTESTNEISLMVQPGTGQQTIAGAPLADIEKSETANRKPTLPALALEMQDSGEFTVAQRITGWSIFGLFGMLFLGWRTFVEFGSSKKRDGLRKRLNSKFAEIEKRLSKGDKRGAAVEMTNTIYFVLGELSGLGGASRELSVLLQKAPPSFRREVAEPLQKLMALIEMIGFAPDEVVRQVSGQSDLKQVVSQLKSLLSRSLDYEFDEEAGA
jgi:hypothetical protein